MSDQYTVKGNDKPGTVSYQGKDIPLEAFSVETQALFGMSRYWSERLAELRTQQMNVQADIKALEIAVFAANQRLITEANAVLANGVLS